MAWSDAARAAALEARRRNAKGKRASFYHGTAGAYASTIARQGILPSIGNAAWLTSNRKEALSYARSAAIKLGVARKLSEADMNNLLVAMFRAHLDPRKADRYSSGSSQRLYAARGGVKPSSFSSVRLYRLGDFRAGKPTPRPVKIVALGKRRR